MGILGIVLLVLFSIVAVLLVLIVLIQDESGDGFGGIFASSSSSTFGSRTGNVITRFTGILGAVFLVSALLLAFVYRSKDLKLDDSGRAKAKASHSSGKWYKPSPAPSLEPMVSDSLEASPSPAQGEK